MQDSAKGSTAGSGRARGVVKGFLDNFEIPNEDRGNGGIQVRTCTL